MGSIETVRDALPLEYALLFEHDVTSADHSMRVARYALSVGVQQTPPNPKLDTLYFGALLHDVGKLYVPRALLTKEGELTTSERAIVDKHARTGEQILNGRYGPTIASIARDHHAIHRGIRTDPLTRIVAVCDEWDALRSDRPYKDSMSIDETVKTLEERYARDADRLEILSILIGMPERLDFDETTYLERQLLERTLS